MYCDKDFRFFFLISFFKKCKKFLGSIFGYMDKCFFYCVIYYLLINIEGKGWVLEKNLYMYWYNEDNYFFFGVDYLV